MNKELIRNAAKHISACMDFIENRYSLEGYSVHRQDVLTEEGMVPSIVATNNPGHTKATFGLDVFAQVAFIVHGDDLEIIDNAALSHTRSRAVSTAILSGGVGFPLLITSGIGAFKQNRLRNRLFSDVSAFLHGAEK